MTDIHHYTPVACDFYDKLLLLVTNKIPVRICIDGSNSTVTGVIEDVYTRNKSEYCVCNALEIRLDNIRELQTLS